jgi:hypothetical protein
VRSRQYTICGTCGWGGVLLHRPDYLDPQTTLLRGAEHERREILLVDCATVALPCTLLVPVSVDSHMVPIANSCGIGRLLQPSSEQAAAE